MIAIVTAIITAIVIIAVSTPRTPSTRRSSMFNNTVMTIMLGTLLIALIIHSSDEYLFDHANNKSTTS